MSQANLLVPGAGGPAGINIIKMFKNEESYKGKIIAIDCDPYASGFFLADKYFVIPKTSESAFENSIIKIIEDNDIGLILPTNESTLNFFSGKKSFFQEKGIHCLFNDPSVMEICEDKWKFFETLQNNIQPPETSLVLLSSFPQIVKPRKGSGSRGFNVINESINYIHNNNQSMIYQEYLPGKEVTVDILYDMCGNYLYSVCRERMAVKAGISTKGRVFHDEIIENESKKICDLINIKGPINIQFKQNTKGKWKILEINPRFGGGTIFTHLAGINIVKFIMYIINSSVSVFPENKIKKNAIVVRYFEEILLTE